MSFADVTFGEPGEVGPKGDTGATGPLGGTPNVNGNVVLDPGTRKMTGPRTRESADTITATGSGVTQVVSTFDGTVPEVLGPRKIVFECLAVSADGTKSQTLDGARRIKMVGSTATMVVSGSDIADDTDGLGVVWSVAIYSTGGGRFAVRITGTTVAGVVLTGAIRELF